MASSGKPKTTMAKLKREAALRERRHDKAARKQIRKLGQPYADRPGDLSPEADDQDPLASMPEGPEMGAAVTKPEGVDLGSLATAPEAEDQASRSTAPEPLLGALP